MRLSKKPFLNGYSAGLEDYAALPFVRQFRIADMKWFDKQSWPFLQKWLQAFLHSQVFKGVMYKYKPWVPGATPIIFWVLNLNQYIPKDDDIFILLVYQVR